MEKRQFFSVDKRQVSVSRLEKFLMTTFKFPREKTVKMSCKFSVEEFLRPASNWIWKKIHLDLVLEKFHMSTSKFPREKSLKMSSKFSVEEFLRQASEKSLRLSSWFGFRKISKVISSIFPTKMAEATLKIFFGKFSESSFNFIRKISEINLYKTLKKSSTFPVQETLNAVSRFSIKNLSNQSPVLLWNNLLD